MSRIGKNPVTVPSGVTLTIDGQNITAKGKLGELSMVVVDEVLAKLEDDKVTVSATKDTAFSNSMWATTRALVQNMVTGVNEGFSKTLELVGVGYRANIKGKDLVLQLGFSHDVIYPIPEGIEIKAPSQTEIIVSGANKQHVGQIAAEIRSYRKPEPYKGKGVRYRGEFILRKEGKKK